MHDTPRAQCLSTNGPLPLQRVQARGRVVGRLLEMQLEQRYHNPEDVNVEVVYTFPLPWHAVLLGLEVEFNGQTLSGIVKARTQARTDYEDALADGNGAVLVTVNPDRTHTLELGNLLPGQSCVVRLRYVQPLQSQQGSLRLLLPATLAPRYGDPVRDGGYEPHAVPQVDPTAEYPFDIRLDIEGELARTTIGSPSHPVTLRTLSGVSGPALQVALGRTARLDRDFVLVFDGIGQASHGLAAWDRLEPGLGVVMAGLTPTLPTSETLPATFKVLVDCSGSMAGDSIQAARRALQRILQALHSGERFSLSRFGSTVEHRSRGLWKATPATLASARRWVERLEADMGGTEMRSAILSTLQLGSGNARAGAGEGPAAQADVLLITDGEIEAIDDVVATARRSQQRFFVVGIGASVAEGLLRRLAETTGGSCEFVAPGEDVEPAVLRLFHRMRAPKVLQARIEWPAGCTVHTEAELPRSLFAGDDVTVFARLHAASAEALCGPVRLYGRIAGAEQETLLAELRPQFIADESNTLARLAAYQHYQQMRQAGDDVPEALRQQLAERYQLVTGDTSLMLIEQRAEGQRAQTMPELRPVKGMLAAGWGGHGSVVSGINSLGVRYSMSHSAMRSDSGPTRVFMAARPSTPGLANSPDDWEVPAFLRSGSSNADMRRVMTMRLEDVLKARGLDATAHGGKCPKVCEAFWTLQTRRNSDIDIDMQAPYLMGLTPAGFLEWLRLNPQSLPATYEALRQTGLPIAVVEWLEFVVGAQSPEAEVVAAFVQVMAARRFTFVQTVASVAGRLPKPRQPVSDTVLQAVRSALASMTDTQWPPAVLDYMEAHEDD